MMFGQVRFAIPAALLLASLLAPGVAAGTKPQRPANVNYALFCFGCHTAEGEGSPLGRIPVLKDAVGHFMRVPEGRRYVVNVPGVVNSDLSPEDTAALLNWIVVTYGGRSKPENFAPFTGEEIVRWRTNPPDDVFALRAKARALLAERGYEVAAYP